MYSTSLAGEAAVDCWLMVCVASMFVGVTVLDTPLV